MKVDLIIKNIGELVFFEEVHEKPELKTLNHGAIAVQGELIAEMGKEQDVLKKVEINSDTVIIDAEGKTVIPGFVDPHTHLVYAGCRHNELELRLNGKSYLEILKAGGGIIQTVKATRNSSEDELLNLAKKRIDILVSYGTTTVEIKSGYGLSTESELKILRVIEKLKNISPVDIISTFLGAHAIPPEFQGAREEYVNLILNEMLKEAKKYSAFCDVFLDEGAFTYEEAKRILKKAKKLGYKLKLHADELSNSGGAKLAGELGAVSADHLDYPDEEGLYKMGKSGTVAVLLPGTGFFLKSPQKPPVGLMRKLGIPIALATDHNPGSSPLYSQALSMTFGVFNYGLTPEEALMAVTLNAAKAIDMHNKVGNIKKGLQADLLILDAHSYIHLIYEVGHNLVETVIKKGKVIKSKQNS